MHLLPVIGFLALTSIASAASGEIVGKIRVQALTPELIRIEVQGPKGFEDRPTFHVVNRDFKQVKMRKTKKDGQIELSTSRWTVALPENAGQLSQVQVLSPDRAVLWTAPKTLSNSEWLPAPGQMPPSWSFADTPRLIPSAKGLVPNGSDPTSGWDVANDAPDVYVFVPKNYIELTADFLKLTGPVPMPPLYELGFTDSRYYPYHAQEALDRIDEYHRRQIPIDMFVIDTDWRLGGSHGYKADPQYFPDMPDFLKRAHEKNVKIMFNDHPEPQAQGALDPAELQYRFDGLSNLMKEGVDVWWYDRNWNVGLAQPADHLRREVWGMKLYHDVALATFPDRRPLIMANVDGIDNGNRNRPPNVAAHRYPVQWTGDTGSTFSFLRKGVENAVYEGVQGLNPWVNEDLGGHIGAPSDELYVRFLQYGAVSPMMRVHCTRGRTREPWAFGPEAEKIAVDYIKLRYRLMPLFYALAKQAYSTGLPMLRRLDLYYPQFKEASANDQFLLGDSLLVAPIVGGQEGIPVTESLFPNGLHAEYFANKDLSGEPAVKRTENNLNFDWKEGSPAEGIPADNFSARWTGQITVPTQNEGGYRLSITGDDGVRLWIDGELLVDKWEPQDSVNTVAAKTLAPGSTHEIKVEYFELTGGALCRMLIEPYRNASTSQRQVWIPPGRWSNVWSGQEVMGPQTITAEAELSEMPMWMREGAIIPTVELAQRTDLIDFGKLSLDVFPGKGAFTLYNDDHISNKYLTEGGNTIDVRSTLEDNRYTLRIEKPKGTWPLTSLRVILHIPLGREIKSVKVDGKSVTSEAGEAVVGLRAVQTIQVPVGDKKNHQVQVEFASGQ